MTVLDCTEIKHDVTQKPVPAFWHRSSAEDDFVLIAAMNPLAVDEQAPFNGIKHSGMGREGGTQGIADHCNVKFGQVVLP